MASNDPSELVGQIGGDDFDRWYQERQFAENIRQGQPYFNGPSPVPAAKRHSPSKLMQCHRKVTYRQENAPTETEPPKGIFWAGSQFEEEIVVPYLRQSVVHDEDVFVRNSMWVDESITHDGTELRVKGSTDPVLVDRESEPLVVTEVKTKGSLDGVSSPNRHHRAQVYAYMHGLSEKYDRDIDEAVIIYGDRDTLDVEAFREPFDQSFWTSVLDWAVAHTEFREEGVLPPADPEQEWECQFCSFKHRCGQSDHQYADVGPDGFLPGLSDYPRAQVRDYLDAHQNDGAKLTPTLAHEYPALAEEYEVYDWRCPNCTNSYAWTQIEWDNSQPQLPICPTCANGGELVTLREPTPKEQH